MVQSVSKTMFSVSPGRLIKASLLAATLTSIPAFAQPDVETPISVAWVPLPGPTQVAAAIAANPNAVLSMAALGVRQILPEEVLNVATDVAVIETTLIAMRVMTQAAFDIALADARAAGVLSAANLVPGPYVPNFGGANRDTVASLNAQAKAAVAASIAAARSYNKTTLGTAALVVTAVAASITTDWARFYAQEYLKTYLINTKGWSTDHAAWGSFVMSQTLGYALTPIIGLTTQWAMAASFNEDISRRRKLLADGMMLGVNYFQRTEAEGRAIDICSQNPYVNVIECANMTYYIDLRNQYASQYDQKYNALVSMQPMGYYNNSRTIFNYQKIMIDAYPANINNYFDFASKIDLKAVFDTVYKTRIQTCTTSIGREKNGSSALLLRCPLVIGKTDAEVRLSPGKEDSRGNLKVYYRVMRSGTQNSVANSAKVFTVNRANINSANYH